MNRKPQPGEIYQHFKGNLYRIVTLAEHTETGEEMVVYQALYGEFQVYVRPLSLFISKVDHDKYPEVVAEYRFTLIPAVTTVQPPVYQMSVQQNSLSEEGTAVSESVLESPDISELAEPVIEECDEIPEEEQEEEFQLDLGLLDFLEADTYEEKLEVFVSLYGKVNESMLNTMAVSLDLELSGDDLDEQYETLKNCLLMLERYECNRLR